MSVDSRDAMYLKEREGAALAKWDTVIERVQQASLVRVLAIAMQLGLLVALAHGFEIESFAFRKVMALALVGFVIHHMLPMSWRLPFFALLSLASLVLVVLPANALRLVLVGGILIGICHLPIRFGWRLMLIAAAATALTLARADLFTLPGLGVLWPILGSMFMFRLIVYLYDLRNQTAPFSFWRSFAYFFMLPNVCFPMYPLVDYQTFNRTYFNEPTPWRMYQVGIKWIFRGLLHLLMYRFVLQNAIIEADHVVDAADLVRYMVTTFLLYLQISGQFHIIIGLLHLFGFNLPETHHNYLLSSSFTDFWRRINIYWKDFIQKVFFNPIYFRVKHWGPATAMTVATLIAFFFTWLLHSYQGFWIRGTFPMTWQDAVFWGGLAVLVLANVLYEQRFGRSRLIKGKKRSIASQIGLGLRTVGTFCTIVTLWCLWTFQGSFREWLEFMGNFRNIDVPTAIMIAAGVTGLGIAGALFGDKEREYSAGQRPKLGQRAAEPPYAFWRSAAIVTVLILLVPAVVKYREHLPLGSMVTTALGDIRREQSVHLRAERDLGYYEDLTNTKSYNLALWELYNRRPAGWVLSIGQTEAGKSVPHEFHQFELAPSKQVEFMGANVSTNRWGMRDKDYEKKKPGGVYRVAVLGSSISMGWGVEDNETYENLIEERLNREYAGKKYNHFEVLNFAVAGYSSFQKLWAFERVLEFEPDVILWEVHATGFTWTVNHLSRVIRADIEIPYPEVREMLKEKGISARTSGLSMRSELRQMAPELQSWVWSHMKRICDERGIVLDVVIVPRADQMRIDEEHLAEMGDFARQSGLAVFDLSKAYRTAVDRTTVAVAPGDAHPNAEGHRMLADALYEKILEAPSWQSVLDKSEPAQAEKPSASSDAATVLKTPEVR